MPPDEQPQAQHLPSDPMRWALNQHAKGLFPLNLKARKNQVRVPLCLRLGELPHRHYLTCSRSCLWRRESAKRLRAEAASAGILRQDPGQRLEIAPEWGSPAASGSHLHSEEQGSGLFSVALFKGKQPWKWQKHYRSLSCPDSFSHSQSVATCGFDTPSSAPSSPGTGPTESWSPRGRRI